MMKPPKMQKEKKRRNVRRRNDGTRQSARHCTGDVPLPGPLY